jgi:hypothetical protein
MNKLLLIVVIVLVISLSGHVAIAAQGNTISKGEALTAVTTIVKYIEQQDPTGGVKATPVELRLFENYSELWAWLNSYDKSISDNGTYPYLNNAIALQKAAVKAGYLVSVDYTTGEAQTIIHQYVYNIDPDTLRVYVHHWYYTNPRTGETEMYGWDGKFRKEELPKIGGNPWK